MSNRFKIIILIIMLVVMSACGGPRQGSVESTINYALELLDAKKYDQVIDELIDPAFIKKMKDKSRLAHMKWAFRDGRWKDVHAALSKAKTMKPKYNRNKTSASFELNKRPDLVLRKINGKWYINN